jgi:hypothetical protein
MFRTDERRYYEIAGITIQVESDLPFADDTFDPKFETFRRDGPGPDTVVIRHHFELPEHDLKAGGEEVYRRPPWAIWRMPDGSWVYEGIAPQTDDPSLHLAALFSGDYGRGDVYAPAGSAQWWAAGRLKSLTTFPSDQVWIAQLLADRKACYLHSGGIAVDGKGLLFVGHSDAGKSTTMRLVKAALGDRAEVLCDDRNIVRRWPDGFHAHGTWSHGDVPSISASGPPLLAILFLEQSSSNEIVLLAERKEVWRRLLVTLIKPLVTADWLNKQIDLLQRLVVEVPAYTMHFDRSGAIVPKLESLLRGEKARRDD